MNNNDIKGMTPTPDGQYAIQIDPDNPDYGWAYYKHADGGWVTMRKATVPEIQAAKYRARGIETLPKPGTIYRFDDKDGTFEDLGVAIGFGDVQGELVQVLRDTSNGQLYFREPEDFVMHIKGSKS